MAYYRSIIRHYSICIPSLTGLIIYDGVVSRAIGNAPLRPFRFHNRYFPPVLFPLSPPLPPFFFVSKASKTGVLPRVLWKLEKRERKKKFFALEGRMDWGGTNEFLSGKIASFIGGELRSWTGLETEKYWILRY